MSSPITVIIADDSVDLSNAVARAARFEPDIRVVCCVETCTGLKALLAELKPSVLLMDLTMPGDDPISVIPEIAELVRVVAFSGYDDSDTRDRVLMAGAWGFVSKTQGPTDVFNAIRTVAAGQMYGLVPG